MRTIKESILFLLLLLCGCNSNKKDITFYIVNNSRVIRSVNIEVIVDTTLFVKQDFNYSGVTPDYTTFVEKYNKGIYKIKVKAGNQIKEDTFNLDKNIYIYISYDAALKQYGDTSRGLAIYKTYLKQEYY